MDDTWCAQESALPSNLAEGLSCRKIPSLDGLRAIAVFLVICYHYGLPSPAGLGVLMFFVLSGFLITWLLLKENDSHGCVSLRRFYARRTLRIFPAFYCYWFFIVAIWILIGRAIEWPQAIASLFYVSNYYQAIFGDPNTGLSHAWSLGIEEQFYLMWPAIFVRLRSSPKQLMRFLSGTIVVVWIHRFLLQYVFGAPQGYIYEAFDTRADHLLIGCLLAVALRTGVLGGLWRFLCRSAWPSVLTVLLLVLSTILYFRFGHAYRNVWAFIFDPVLTALLIPQLIAHRSTLIWRWLGWRWVVYLGVISYPLYLYHQIGESVGRRVAALAPGDLELVMVVAATVMLASCSYYLVERPFLRLKSRFAA
jgi:peptidoglycan/LPS O-acetylase OafA/YrhL